ncbi:kinase-like domain-containing protein [Chaetomium sp. MPI-SDFR-AT-0129]|nr:kinase-like domain-containing protein [Chaetomium sp. MPI-SDFR-AT-0129]
MKDMLVNERYRVDRKIGKGGFGLVYSGTDLSSGEEVALKLTFLGDDPEMPRAEKEIYETLKRGVGIPRMRWFGQECDFYALVLDALGPSLEDLLNYCGRKFSLKTILLIADQAISRVQYIHSKSVLHRDIKPDNFLMGVGRQGNTLYTIDFGLAKEFDAERSKNVDGLPFAGTRRYASINNHGGREQSWGDDLESLGYIFVYFARGSLPWQGLEIVSADGNNKDARIKEMKENLSGEALCNGCLPVEFATFIDYTRGLAFNEKPNYPYLRRLFQRCFRAAGFEYGHVFDWTEKLLDERERTRSQNTA